MGGYYSPLNGRLGGSALAMRLGRRNDWIRDNSENGTGQPTEECFEILSSRSPLVVLNTLSVVLYLIVSASKV